MNQPVPDSRRKVRKANTLCVGLRGGVVALLLTWTSCGEAADGRWIRASTGGSWSNVENWDNGIIADQAGAVADFRSIDLIATNIVHLDIPRTVGSIVFRDTEATTPASWLLDNNSNPLNTLRLNAGNASPTITVEALGQDASATLDLTIAGTNGLLKAGPGTLIFDEPNTYRGGTAIAAGTVIVNSTSNLGAGALSFTNASNVPARVVLNSPQNITSLTTASSTNKTSLELIGASTTLTIDAGTSDMTFSGVLAGAGSVAKYGTGMLTLNQSNTLSGTVSIFGGGLTLDLSAFTSATQVSLPNSSTLQVAGANILTRVNQLTPVNQSLKLVISPGASAFTQSRGSSGLVINTFSTVVRSPGATIALTEAGNGSGYRLSAAANINGVIPWATFGSDNWLVANGTSGNAVPFNNYFQNTPGYLGAPTQNANIANDLTVADGGASINTIRFSQGRRTIRMLGEDTLTVSAGGILVAPSVQDNRTSIVGGKLSGGIPVPGAPPELLILQNNPNTGVESDMMISSEIIDSVHGATSLTKSGVGLLRLTNPANTYGGRTFLNSGTLRIVGDGSLGAVPDLTVSDAMVFSGATLQLLGGMDFDIAATRGMQLQSAGGTLDTRTTNTSYDGIIAGVGSFTKAGDGKLTLTQPNVYTGGTIVRAGSLFADNVSGSATATGPVTVAAGAALGGTGTVTGRVSLTPGPFAGGGGRLSPGSIAAIGDLSVGAAHFTSNSVLDIEFSTSGQNDVLKVLEDSGLMIDGGGFNLISKGTPNKWVTPGSYNLVQYSGSLSGTGLSLWTDNSVLNRQAGLTYDFESSNGSVRLTIGGRPTGPIINTMVLSGRHAPGESATTNFQSVNGAGINASGQAVIAGFLPSLSSSGGIWANLDGSVVPVAKPGQQAPGLAIGAQFTSVGLQSASGPHIDESGRIAFLGVLAPGSGGITQNDNRGIWFGLPGAVLPVIRSGSQAPGTPDGTVFGGFESLMINGEGQMAFKASLGDGIAPSTSSIWVGSPNGAFRLIAREGSPAPGVSDGSVFESSLASGEFHPFSRLQISERGLVSFAGRLDDDRRGIWVGNEVGVSLVALGGEPAAGAAPGSLFVRTLVGGETRAFTVSAGGNVAFASRLQEGTGGTTSANQHGLWARIGGTLMLVAREGSPVPGLTAGVSYSYSGANPFDAADVNDAGSVVFKAHFAGSGASPDNDSGIFTGQPLSLSLVAREGFPAPGFGAGFVFADFSTVRPRINETGQFAFNADVISGGQTSRGLWIFDPQGGLSLLMKKGDPFEVAPGDVRVVSGVGGNLDSAFASAKSFNDAGQLVFSASFTDGTQGVFTAMIPEPGSFGLVVAAAAAFGSRRSRRQITP